MDIFDMDELKLVIKKLKNNKSPGPDGMPTDFFKYMNDECLEIVLEVLNDCWKKEIMPSELELAELVTLYEKKETSKTLQTTDRSHY